MATAQAILAQELHFGSSSRLELQGKICGGTLATLVGSLRTLSPPPAASLYFLLFLLPFLALRPPLVGFLSTLLSFELRASLWSALFSLLALIFLAACVVV